MGKMKVYELAKELNLSNNELIGKLKGMGIEVKSHLSAVTEEQYNKFRGIPSDGVSKKIPDAKKTESSPHIIRRNVKVINTDNDKNEIEQITTNITGKVKKSHQTIINTENIKSDNSYSKEGLGVITPKYGRERNNNVVVTRNGKKVEEESQNKEVVEEKSVNVEENNKPTSDNNYQKKPYNNSNYDRKPYNNNNSNYERKPYNNNNTQDNRDGNFERRPYNNNNNSQDNRSGNFERRPYNNNNNTQDNRNGNFERRPYNNNNSQDNRNGNFERRPYNNNNTQDNRSGNFERRPYNNNNTQDNRSGSFERRPYNNNNSQDNRSGNFERRPYNNNNSQDNRNGNFERRPYNNNNSGYNNNTGYNNNSGYNNNNSGFNKRPFNNNNSTPGGFRNNRFDSSLNKVDKFMKQTSENQQVEQKETRDYSTTLIDKKKYNNNSNSFDGKKSSINKNDLREKHTRVKTSNLKGLEVNSSSSMLDLYERDTDSVRKTNRRKKEKKIKTLNQTKIIPLTEIKIHETMTVKELAETMKKKPADVIKKLFSLGILATVNQEIDFDTAFLIAEEFGITAEKQVVVTEEDILFDDTEDSETDMIARPPIVVVMGHVDHGKTSLLDSIRSARVASGEHGGITQHIGAYKVKVNDKEICFLDTPGHEAFTEMRARGANVTDIAVIVVAADDGIKPQTIEAIDHAKAAGVSIIVAINKIDKPSANVEKVKQELLEVGLISEEWGGDTICVPISALTGEGVDNLLEMILLAAEMKELKANPNKQAKGTVIEARLDKNIGTITSLIVQRGTLNVGDTIVIGDIIGKVRAMKDDKGKQVKSVGPSTPVEIIGLGTVPQTGDVFYEVEDEKTAKQLVSKRKADIRRNLVKEGAKVTLEDLFGQIKEGEIKDLNIIVKADVQGTLEALKNSLEKIANEEVKVKVIHAATGGIKESDVTLASVSNAIIIGFNVRPESTATAQAEKEKVDVRLYNVIYDAINDVESAMKGMLKPIYKEVMNGTAEVRAIFKVSSIGTIAGCYIKSGSILRNAMCRVIRDSVVIAESKIDTLKREKDDAKEVKEGYECGIKLEKFNDIIVGDMIECYTMVEEKR